MDKAIIVGAGTYGEVYSEYITENLQYELVGFVDDDSSKHGKIVNGYRVLGNVDYLKTVENRNIISVFVPIGNNDVRCRILNFCRDLGFNTPGFIHKSCTIHNTVKMGQSVYILPSTSIMPFAQLEDNVMISMGVNIAHHTVICNSSFVSQGANIGASLKIGARSFIGIASTIMTGISEVGENVTVGAGAVVIRDLPSNVVVAGIPARIIKTKEPLIASLG